VQSGLPKRIRRFNAVPPQLTRDLGLNGIAMIARLASGLVLFVLMARLMGVVRFGEFMYSMTLATIASLPSTLGFGPQVLREVGANPEDVRDTVRRITAAKIFLAGLVLGSSVVFTAIDPQKRLLFFVLLLAALCDSFSEYLFCVLRARGQFMAEARVTLVASTFHCAGILLVLAITKDPLIVGMAFLSTRMFLLISVIRLSPVTFQDIRWPKRFRDVALELRRSISYSIDATLAILMTQLDTVLVRSISGSADVGIYQAGMRLVLGFQNFTGVAANVFIPRLASATGESDRYIPITRATVKVFVGLGVMFGAILFSAGDFLVLELYGTEYLALRQLVPMLAALIFVRFCASAYGVQLTAMGCQRSRTIVNAGGLSLVVVLIYCFAPSLGLQGVLLAMILAATAILISFWILVDRSRSRLMARDKQPS
jgi:O-antigen/teichoic acid export membrane protein